MSKKNKHHEPLNSHALRKKNKHHRGYIPKDLLPNDPADAASHTR